MSMMKKYSIEFEIAVRDPGLVIQKAKEVCKGDAWQHQVDDLDGDELFAAVCLLFSPPRIS